MPHDELQNIANNEENWVFLGKGTFHNVYLSKKHHQLGNYNGFIVFKKSRHEEEPLSSIERSIRKWTILNPKYPAVSLENGWIAPYLGNEMASDDEIANKLIEIYRDTRIIVADACVNNNFLKYNGDIVCIDVDYAFKRGSFCSIPYLVDEDIEYEDLMDLLGKLKLSMPKTTSVINTLLYLDKHCPPYLIQNKHITPKVIKIIRLLRLEKQPIDMITLDRILKMTEMNTFYDFQINQIIWLLKCEPIIFDFFLTILTKRIDLFHKLLINLKNNPLELQFVLNQKFLEKYTPIEVAAMTNQWDIVEVIALNSRTDSQDSKNYASALLISIKNNQNNTARILIYAGALNPINAGILNTNDLLNHAVMNLSPKILSILCSNIDKPIIQRYLFSKNQGGLRPLEIAAKFNHKAVLPLLNLVKNIDDIPGKLMLIFNAKDDLIIAAESNIEIFNTLVSCTNKLNYSDHCKLYDNFLLRKNRDMSKKIYKLRIYCLIYELISSSNGSTLLYRVFFSEQLKFAYKDYLNTRQTGSDLIDFNVRFNDLVTNLLANKKQSRKWVFWSLFSCCNQSCLPDEDLLLISKIKETLTNLGSLLDDNINEPINLNQLEIVNRS